jgi:Rrf2 family protein
MKLTQTAGYAIGALTHVAKAAPGKVVSAVEICNSAGMPDRYVLQLLGKLAKAGIVVATRGREGGYLLARPASTITLLEIIEAADGALDQSLDIALPGLTRNSKAAVRHALNAAVSEARKQLQSVTLAHLRAAK